MSSTDLTERKFRSPTLGNTRTVWIQPQIPTSTDDVRGVCIFLDAEYYLPKIGAAEIVERLQAEGLIPPMLVAYASHIDHVVRWPESFCNRDFARFLAKELLPWLANEFGVSQPAENVLAGLSLTGLSAAHAALRYPDAFARVLCQSASFWWNDGWLIDDVARRPAADVTFRITVGDAETDEPVDHGEGLIQRESQLSANRRMRDALRAKGNGVSYHEFAGGHEIDAWRVDLAGSLASLFM